MCQSDTGSTATWTSLVLRLSSEMIDACCIKVGSRHSPACRQCIPVSERSIDVGFKKSKSLVVRE